MKILITNALWINPGDPLSGSRQSIRLIDGKVAETGTSLVHNPDEQLVDANGTFCSPGWLDMKVNATHAYFHLHESHESLANAAAAGGFTRILLQPNEETPLQTVEAVRFYTTMQFESGVRFLVSAAATKDLRGEKMAEVRTLRMYGASSFSAPAAISNSFFMAQLIRYLKADGCTLMHSPMEQELSFLGQIHDGSTAANRGLTGIPSVAEDIVIDRDLNLLRYYGGRVHFSSLSAATAVKKIAQAKTETALLGNVTADVCTHQLLFTHHKIDPFNTEYKVWPPYREEEDRQALIEGVKNGSIDVVTSGHMPWQYDFKDVEFGNAQFGTAGIETAFSCLCTAIQDIDPECIVSLLSTNPRKILGLQNPSLHVGMEADFTLFSTDKTFVPRKENWQSLSVNNPLLNTELKGLVLGIVTATGFHQNSHSATVL